MATDIILDCDPGHDDAIALLLAHGNPLVNLLAVTTVHGNQRIGKVTRNALAVARIAGITGVPFAAGAHRPLVRAPEVAAAIHGDSGLDGPSLPEPTLAADARHAVDLIIDTLMAAPPGSRPSCGPSSSMRWSGSGTWRGSGERMPQALRAPGHRAPGTGAAGHRAPGSGQHKHRTPGSGQRAPGTRQCAAGSGAPGTGQCAADSGAPGTRQCAADSGAPGIRHQARASEACGP